MWLEDYTPVESSEWWTQSTEVSEVFKESVKKASAGMKRTKKDEWKARTHDMLLAGFLVQLLLDKKYDPFLQKLFDCLSWGFPSNFILWIVSLIKEDISNKIREISMKPIIEYSYKSPSPIHFDDSNLHPQVKQRINEWVEDMVDSVTIEYSSLMTVKILELIDDNELLIDYISSVFVFFLKESNIVISKQQSENIVYFILWEVKSSIEKLSIDNI